MKHLDIINHVLFSQPGGADMENVEVIVQHSALYQHPMEQVGGVAWRIAQPCGEVGPQ